MPTEKTLDHDSLSGIFEPCPFEKTLPYFNYEFSKRLFRLNHDWGIPTELEVNFITSYLTRKPSRILDLACGAGRHSRALAGLGHKVKGIDIGGYPIRVAERLARRGNLHANFIRKDLKDIEYSEEFDLAFLICGQLGHFSPEENSIIFTKASLALRPDGIFIVHINRLGADDKRNLTQWFQEKKPLYMRHPSLVHREQYYFEKERVKLLRDFAIDSVTQEHRLFGISQKEYTSEELLDLGSRAELAFRESFGSYERSPLANESRDMIFVFQKR